MYPFKRAPLPSLALAAADVGVRRYIELEGNSYNYFLYAVITATVQISVGAATAIRNAGSAAALFDVIGVEENGADRIILDPRVARFLAEALAPSALSVKRLTSTAVATYQLREVVPIFFSLPHTMDPSETAFREKDPTAKTKFFVQYSATAAARLLTVGGATVAITNVNVDLEQAHNRYQKHLPKFVPTIRQVMTPINGANAEQSIPLVSSKYLAGVAFTQDSDAGEVDDIVNKLSIRSDIRDYIGPKMQKWVNLTGESELELGGAVNRVAGLNTAADPKPAHLFVNFCQHGRLSTLIEPNETNLRALLDVQPSVLSTNSLVRVTLLELDRDLGKYSGPTGLTRLVVDPDPLPWLAPAPTN